MAKSKTAIIAAGGTGGHMFPAQGLADELLARGWNVVLTTDERGMRYADGFDASIEKLILPSASFSQGSMAKRLQAPFTILRGFTQAKALFERVDPSAVIGFGGYPSLPSLMVAKLKKTPYYIHEQNAVLGRVNKRFQAGANKVACGLWPVKYAGENAVYIGNPVREAVRQFENSPMPSSKPFEILVFGGSQGASALSKIVPHAISLLPESLRSNIHLTQQAREGEIETVKSDYQKAGVKAEVASFFNDLPKRIANSHFVIARSGASTLAELQCIGRGSVLVPLPTATNDHQRANAKAMVEAGAALEFDEADNTAEALALWLQDILTSPNKLAEMGESAYKLSRPKAAEALAELIGE